MTCALFSQTIDLDQRVRIGEDGHLEIENKAIRKEACCFSRLWTRSEYNQSTVLKQTKKLFQQALANQEVTLALLRNYAEIIRRARSPE